MCLCDLCSKDHHKAATHNCVPHGEREGCSLEVHFYSKWSIDACVGVARKEKLFTSVMMVCTKTLYNYVYEGLFLLILDFPCIVKRKRTKYIQRTRKRNLGLSIDDRSNWINQLPRKLFGYKPSEEMFIEEVSKLLC